MTVDEQAKVKALANELLALAGGSSTPEEPLEEVVRTGYVLKVEDHFGPLNGILGKQVDGTIVRFFDIATGVPETFTVTPPTNALTAGQHCKVTVQPQPPFFDKLVSVEKA